MTALKSSGLSPAMPDVTWSQLMLRIAPPPSCSRIAAPAAYEHAIVPLRSTASRRSSLRSQSQSASVAGEHVGAGVVDPYVEAAEPLARLGDERLAARARAEVGARDERVAAALRDAGGDRARGRLAAAISDEHRGAGAGERFRDRRRRCRCSRP